MDASQVLQYLDDADDTTDWNFSVDSSEDGEGHETLVETDLLDPLDHRYNTEPYYIYAWTLPKHRTCHLVSCWVPAVGMKVGRCLLCFGESN